MVLFTKMRKLKKNRFVHVHLLVVFLLLLGEERLWFSMSLAMLSLGHLQDMQVKILCNHLDRQVWKTNEERAKDKAHLLTISI